MYTLRTALGSSFAYQLRLNISKAKWDMEKLKKLGYYSIYNFKSTLSNDIYMLFEFFNLKKKQNLIFQVSGWE